MKIFCIFVFLFVFVFVCAKNHSKCGTKGPVQSKIIGGIEATPHEWPWIVSMGYKFERENETFSYQSVCTGSIIHHKFVLTSAKCVKTLSSMPYGRKYMLFGAHNVSLDASEPLVYAQDLGTIIVHPKYSNDSFGNVVNDVALIKLFFPVEIYTNPNLGTICVPNQDETYNPYQGKLVTTVGWGATKILFPKPSKVLIKVSFPVKSMDECAQMYDIPENNRNTMICTYQVGNSPCVNDEGGPLMLQENGKWTVVGTSSWTRDNKCGEEKHPYMYTHMSLYSDWIWETVKKNGGH